MHTLNSYNIPNLENTGSGQFLLIAGPCVVESENLCMEVAGKLKDLTQKLDIPYIFKASVRKANRSRADAFRGIGNSQALDILSKIKNELNLPVITDVHEAQEVTSVAEKVDLLQIPAFLCRQTDLLEAAAQSNLPVNIKKGQFLAPESMQFAIEKITRFGNHKILLTERGSSFGHHDLVVDFRGFPIMKNLGYPVIYDVTHSLQQPNQKNGISGGLPGYIGTMAKAGLAAGADGLFMEIHPDPPHALSDGANMLSLDLAGSLLEKLSKLRQTLNEIDTSER